MSDSFKVVSDLLNSPVKGKEGDILDWNVVFDASCDIETEVLLGAFDVAELSGCFYDLKVLLTDLNLVQELSRFHLAKGF